MASRRHAPVRRNTSRESTRVAAVTNDDFPRVLNGPAPGYAEDALRRLLLCGLPSEGRKASAAGSRELTIELDAPELSSRAESKSLSANSRRTPAAGRWREEAVGGQEMASSGINAVGTVGSAPFPDSAGLLKGRGGWANAAAVDLSEDLLSDNDCEKENERNCQVW